MAKKCGFTHKKCIKHDCMFYQQFRGENPQTGQEEDKFECVQVMTPLLLIENARQQRSTAAALESTRNVLKEAADASLAFNQMQAIGDDNGNVR